MDNKNVVQNRERFLQRNAEKWGEYTILSEYKNTHTKIEMKHELCGNVFNIAPYNFSEGHGCPVCGRKQKAKSLMRTKGSRFLDYLKEADEYELLEEYKGVSTPVRMFHKKCGREFRYIPQRFYSKRQPYSLCPFCNREHLSSKYRFNLKEANARLADTNRYYRFVTYNGASENARIEHLVCGHIFTGKASYYLLGDGHCPKCTTNVSKEEREIYDWVRGLCPDAEHNVRYIDGITELDIYVPSRQVAIEYNGHYWHSYQAMTRPRKDGKKRMTSAQAKRCHYEKSAACERQGIRLIHIWDYEWADERTREVLKNIVLGALGMLPERYYARQCRVCRYDKGCRRWKELNEFFAQNNVQKNRGGSVVFTLEKDDRILMAYKFGRPSGGRAKQLYEYEMVRGAAAPGVQVVGGATRLWKHAMAELRPRSVVYYVDFNYFDGRSVEKLGGEYIGSQPGVKNYWVTSKKVKNREPARHREVKAAIARGEVLELWNAGTKTYAFHYPENQV